MITNFTRHPLNAQSTEYTFVSDKFYRSWGNLKNQPPVSTNIPRPTIQLTPGAPRAPLPPSVPVPPTNNLPPYLFSTPLLPTMPTMHPSTNNNSSGPTGNPPLQPPLLPMPNYAFAPISHHMPRPTNTMVPQGSLPSLPLPPGPPLGPPPGPHQGPPLGPPPGSHPGPQLGTHPGLPPPPPVSYYPQPTYGPAMVYTRSKNLPQPPTNNVGVRTRQHRHAIPTTNIPQIIQIERIQNQRWYKQYSAHECEFRQKLGKQTEQWLFHGK